MIKVISILLYTILFVGIILSFLDSFTNEAMKLRIKKETLKKIEKKEEKKSSGKGVYQIVSYIDSALRTVYGARFDVNSFIIFSVILGVAAFILSLTFMTKKVAILFGLLFLFIPFLFLRMKLHEVRASASKEGEALCEELLNNYKIQHNSMLEAIRTTAFTITDEAIYSKRLLLELSHKLNTAATKDEIKKAVSEFKFGIETTWAFTLATNMELSLIEGIKVTSSMEDLIDTIVKARKTLEERKRQGNESNKMLKFLVPAIYLLTVFSSIKFFNFTLKKFIYYQFQTDLGATWFLLIVISYIASLVVSSILGKRKMDI